MTGAAAFIGSVAVLIDVSSDKQFQRYLDQEEQRLYLRMWPVVTTFHRLAVLQNMTRAQTYFTERGQAVMLAAYRRIYHDQYMAITNAQNEKAVRPTLNAFMEEQLAYLASKAGSRITGMSVTMTRIIGELIMERVRAGKTPTVIAREIRELAPELSKFRAATIARTETHNAALAAIEATANYRRIPVRNKTWWTAADDKVRPAHAAVHGVTVPWSEPFDVDGFPMMRPGDEGAPPELVINCRCSLLLNTE